MCIDAPCAIEFSPRFLCRYPMHSRRKKAFSAENRRLKKASIPRRNELNWVGAERIIERNYP